jgi:hypothetical protein
MDWLTALIVASACFTALSIGSLCCTGLKHICWKFVWVPPVLLLSFGVAYAVRGPLPDAADAETGAFQLLLQGLVQRHP